jgi:hypothetical protein
MTAEHWIAKIDELIVRAIFLSERKHMCVHATKTIEWHVQQLAMPVALLLRVM